MALNDLTKMILDQIQLPEWSAIQVRFIANHRCSGPRRAQISAKRNTGFRFWRLNARMIFLSATSVRAACFGAQSDSSLANLRASGAILNGLRSEHVLLSQPEHKGFGEGDNRAEDFRTSVPAGGNAPSVPLPPERDLSPDAACGHMELDRPTSGVDGGSCSSVVARVARARLTLLLTVPMVQPQVLATSDCENPRTPINTSGCR